MIRIHGGAGMGGSYRDLRVWQNAMKLVASIYRETQKFPDEVYGLISQMRRAPVSVPSNIAEGKGRLTDRDRAHFFSQARGSLFELETQVLIARELGFLSEGNAAALTPSSAELGRMLNALVRSIRPKFEKPAA